VIPQISAEDAARLLERNPDAAYLDVRTEAEYRAGHPRGAYNVPVMFFDAARRPVPNPDFLSIVEAKFPREKTLLVGCQSGVRSQHAAEILASHGYGDVSNVAGGYGGSAVERGWRDSGLPIESGDSADRSYEDLKKTS
jgi:rhodanese-related sulfurtransferase